LELGFVTEAEFNCVVDPAKMVVHTSRKSADGSIHVYADPGLKDAPLRRYSRSSSENE
jgi:hypothetical protein